MGPYGVRIDEGLFGLACKSLRQSSPFQFPAREALTPTPGSQETDAPAQGRSLSTGSSGHRTGWTHGTMHRVQVGCHIAKDAGLALT